MAPKIVKFLRRSKSAKADMRSHNISSVEHSFVDSIPYENSNEELNVSKGPFMFLPNKFSHQIYLSDLPVLFTLGNVYRSDLPVLCFPPNLLELNLKLF
jgi:hypothetical protein